MERTFRKAYDEITELITQMHEIDRVWTNEEIGAMNRLQSARFDLSRAADLLGLDPVG